MGSAQSKPPPFAPPGHGYGRGYRHRSSRTPSRASSSLPTSSSLLPHAPPFPAPAPGTSAMPSFFSFVQGSERAQHVRYHAEASPLLGRFRAVPRPPPTTDRGLLPRRAGTAPPATAGLGLFSTEPGNRGSVHVGYGALIAAAAEQEEEEGPDDDDEDDDDGDEDWEGAGVCCGNGRGLRKGARRMRRGLRQLHDTWVDPKASVVRRLVDVWWSRWGTLVVLPALLVG